MRTSNVSSKIQEQIANRNSISFCVVFSRLSVPKPSCRIIRTVQNLSNNQYFVFIENRRQEKKIDLVFRVWQTQDEKKDKNNTEKYEETVSADLEEEQIVVVPSSYFDVNQYLKYENDKQRPLFYHAFAVRYTVEFVFLNK